LSAANWLTLVGILATAGVAISAQIITQRDRRDERVAQAKEATAARDQSERVSRADRHYAARLNAYTRVGQGLEAARMQINRTAPLTGPDLSGAPVPAELDTQQIIGTVAVAGSAEVIAAISDVGTSWLDFAEKAEEYLARRSQGERLENTGTEMQAAREATIAAIDRAERMMREELHEL
jgi:hypothetical protein